MGENSDATALKSITDNVLVFKETTKESYQAFFKWVSSSIHTSSKEIGENGKEVNASILKKSGKIWRLTCLQTICRQKKT